MTSSFPFGSKNLCKLLCVSWEVFVCTDTTGSIGWPSLVPRLSIDDCFEIHNLHWERTLWSAVIISPTFPGRGMAAPVRFLQGALVISVLKEASINTVFARYQFSSRLWRWFTRRTRRCVPRTGTLLSTRFSVNSFNHSGTSRDGFPCFSFFGFCGHATGLPVLCYSYCHFLLMWEAM